MEDKQTTGSPEAGSGSSDNKAGGDPSAPPMPEISFAAFIISLSSSAMFHFGEIPDPVTKQTQRNLALAKQTIDILGLLKEKTAGNLDREENQLLSSLLYDLRMRYIEQTKKEPG